jgi:hypothetical protein
VRNSGKSYLRFLEEKYIYKGTGHMHAPIIRRKVRQVYLTNLNDYVNIIEMSFRKYSESYVNDPGEPLNFSLILQDLTGLYGSDREMLAAALRYLLTHFVGNGLAPMNFVNATDHEYGPVTKYGVRPQEIIDNIMAAWLAGGDYFVDDFELMFGWERYCGAFIEDDEPEDVGSRS